MSYITYRSLMWIAPKKQEQSYEWNMSHLTSLFTIEHVSFYVTLHFSFHFVLVIWWSNHAKTKGASSWEWMGIWFSLITLLLTILPIIITSLNSTGLDWLILNPTMINSTNKKKSNCHYLWPKSMKYACQSQIHIMEFTI